MMRKSVLFGFAFLLFSCTAGFIIEPQKGTVGLGEAVFPEPEPFVPDPIEVTGLRATQETYINEIHVTWNTVSAGVYYWRLFWFTSAAEAETEREEALSDGFYQTDEISVRAPVSPRLSVAADSYEHIFTYAADGSEIPLPSGQTFYYLLKGYDGASRITACSEIAVGKTAAVPYDVTASRNYQPQKPEDPAFITLMWKWDNPDSVFRVERAKAPFSSEQTWTDRGIVKPEFKDGFYTYIEEFSHDDGCSFGSEDNPDVKCSESCLINLVIDNFGYREDASEIMKNAVAAIVIGLCGGMFCFSKRRQTANGSRCAFPQMRPAAIMKPPLLILCSFMWRLRIYWEQVRRAKQNQAISFPRSKILPAVYWNMNRRLM